MTPFSFDHRRGRSLHRRRVVPQLEPDPMANITLESTTTDAALTIFEMQNVRGYIIPELNIHYEERTSGLHWFITCGGYQAYILRTGKHGGAKHDQMTDSHFIINRVVSSLMLSRAGLFNPIPRGRVFFNEVKGIEWSAQTFMELTYSDEVKRIHSGFNEESFEGWFIALSNNTFLRRAADDAVLAMRNPTEAFIYIYRGFEWLEDGLKISKKELANAIGGEFKNLKDLGKLANVGTGVRHASKTGIKMRANFTTDPTWICGLIDGINYARTKLDPGFAVMPPTEVADLVRISIAYPYR